MSESEHKKPVKTNVKLTWEEGITGGRYTNLQIVAASETEFIVDFGFVQPQEPKGMIHSRLIMSPRHAKGLMRTLVERIRIHEQRFGEIPMPVGNPTPQGGGLVN
jgi:hypothetical protein